VAPLEGLLARRERDAHPPGVGFAMSCRFCGTLADHVFVDLGMSPLCESFLQAGQLNQMEPFYPLRVHVCPKCFLVQLAEYVSPADIFTEYAYFSSYSKTWVEHARVFADSMRRRLQLTNRSFVIEIASNDGYLLQHFVAAGIPVLGIEPAVNVAAAARARNVPTRSVFFGVEAAQELAATGERADLLIGNNVLAQVPDLNDFVAGLRLALKPTGTLTLEFPHLMRLIEGNQFDTIYHEHFSYFSLLTTARIFAAHGLTVFDVEELPTHGGSLRLYVRHEADEARPVAPRVSELLSREARAGLDGLRAYTAFDEQVKATKRKLLEFLIGVRKEGKSIAGYGAPGKGNTLLNYCGIRSDFLEYTVDGNPYKHYRFLPGTHIPIFPPDKIAETRPDYVLILPWNLKDEIVEQLAYIREWGGQCVVPIPEVRVCG
jgi:2-polyprenyl-3-methyl-5-hydroxy-6-metoxy-1,4-benzoquinol methylase